jgi:hypothetical protein
LTSPNTQLRRNCRPLLRSDMSAASTTLDEAVNAAPRQNAKRSGGRRSASKFADRTGSRTPTATAAPKDTTAVHVTIRHMHMLHARPSSEGSIWIARCLAPMVPTCAVKVRALTTPVARPTAEVEAVCAAVHQ